MLSEVGAIGIAQAAQEKPKNGSSFDEETIANMVRYYRVDEKNFESLLRYIRTRGLPDESS
jgi:hypothetical protein